MAAAAGWVCLAPDERMALRHDDDDLLDDVVVRRVSMFRAEMLDSDHLWLCCYLPGTGVDSDRVAFDVTVRDGKIAFELVEMPEGSVFVEPSHR
jgi:hypothetical protein